MNASQSGLHMNQRVHSPEGLAFPFVARIAEPAETLLVVDDDPAIRDLEARGLRHHGYQVLEAENAAEALRLATTTVPIHLLITDFMMPEVDGLELTRRFRVVHPETPVLLVSGSLPLLGARSEQDLERIELLAKPFALDELLHKVRTLLDAAAPLPIRERWCCD